ncbi:hypothetical protein niasHS_004215 [Heterodera schachtii]|uniref:CCHC-type domain-containing protein n=1 Tax=Heterodera schachtii TaxID=97005 RepID=A0ABD2JT83_HETSC
MCMDTWSLNVPHTVLVATMEPRVWRALPVKALATARTREWCWVLGVMQCAVAYLGKPPVFPEQFVGQLNKCFVCGEDGHLWRRCRFGQLRAQFMEFRFIFKFHLTVKNFFCKGHEQFGPAPPDRRVGGHDRVGGRLRWDYRPIVRPRNEIRFTKFMLANGAAEDAKYERQRAVARITAAQREDTPWKWKGAMKPFDVITEAELNVWHRRYGSQRVILMHRTRPKILYGQNAEGTRACGPRTKRANCLRRGSR